MQINLRHITDPHAALHEAESISAFFVESLDPDHSDGVICKGSSGYGLWALLKYHQALIVQAHEEIGDGTAEALSAVK